MNWKQQIYGQRFSIQIGIMEAYNAILKLTSRLLRMPNAFPFQAILVAGLSRWLRGGS